MDLDSAYKVLLLAGSAHQGALTDIVIIRRRKLRTPSH